MDKNKGLLVLLMKTVQCTFFCVNLRDSAIIFSKINFPNDQHQAMANGDRVFKFQFIFCHENRATTFLKEIEFGSICKKSLFMTIFENQQKLLFLCWAHILLSVRQILNCPFQCKLMNFRSSFSLSSCGMKYSISSGAQ